MAKKYSKKPEVQREMDKRARAKKLRTDRLRTARPADDWRTRRPNTPKES
jgi:hypothetical protein